MKIQHLIIIRGNSGSGKSTVANVLRNTMCKKFGKGSTMLVAQDMVRHTILDGNGASPNQSLDLMYAICQNGMANGQHVILEGILEFVKYGGMLNQLIYDWRGRVHIYYYDIPLEITLQRHDGRPMRDLFTEQDLRNWYIEKDMLSVPNERIFDENISVDQAVAQILADCAEEL